jgi:acetyl-CoA carboxylase biotin carboxyl carrier protein
MYSFEELCELIRLVGSTEVARVEIKEGEFKLRIEGQQPAPLPVATVSDPGTTAPLTQVMVDPPPAPVAAKADTAVSEATEEEEGLHFVTSPIVGTFYRAPSPDSDPYVKVGDFVEKGQVLCIVEAMKLMNEIESDVSGTIVKVFQENAQPIEFGQRLFAVRLA